MSFIVTDVYHSTIGGESKLRYARVKNEDTGEEVIAEPHQIHDPENVEVGDSDAYQVQILSNLFKENPWD